MVVEMDITEFHGVCGDGLIYNAGGAGQRRY